MAKAKTKEPTKPRKTKPPTDDAAPFDAPDFEPPKPLDGNAVIEGVGPITLERHQLKSYHLAVKGVPYTHVGTDAHGRWIYRRA